MEEIIKDLRNVYRKWEHKNFEANIRQHVISETFLEKYGYNVADSSLEEPVGKKRCDIWVPIGNNDYLIIEVKRGKEVISTEDIQQTQIYVKGKNRRFAILTNGYEYVLLDFDIKSSSLNFDDIMKSYVVFWFNIFKAKGNDITELRYFKYLKYENLAKNQITRYFCDIAQYRVWKFDDGMKKQSWVSYQSTLFQFFDLYGAKRKKYDSKHYGQIDMEDFHDFIKKCKRNGDNTSKATIENNYTHISNLLAEMEKRQLIWHSNLDEGRKKSLAEYATTQQKNRITEIKAEGIESAINYFKTTRRPTRNIAMFLLSISTGIGRMQLGELKWGDIDNEYGDITIDGRKIILPTLIKTYLKNLDKERKQRKGKLDYVFQTYHKKSYKAFAQSSSNDIFAGLSKQDNRWKGYSLQHMRNYLIPYLFQKGFSLDQIIYIAGIDINNVSHYISTESIIEREKKTGKGKFAWGKLYDGILNEEKV